MKTELDIKEAMKFEWIKDEGISANGEEFLLKLNTKWQKKHFSNYMYIFWLRIELSSRIKA